MFRFEHLEIWKDAVVFARAVYMVTKTFPREELFALGDQLRRAAVSVSANIAEGSGSHLRKDFRNYLSIAIKSIFETVSLLAIALENKYLSEDTFKGLYRKADLLVKRTSAFRNSLQKS